MVNLFYGSMSGIRDLSGKTAVVTGGSSGIGLETAKLLARSGCNVVVVGRDRKRLKSARSSLGKGAVAISCNVADWSDVEVMSESVLDDIGHPDILINSAGIVHPHELSKFDPDRMREIVEVDLLGTMNVCRAFVPGMKRGSWITNISSVAGYIGLYGYGPYSGAKFGVMGFSEALRMELRPRGIGVSVVFPPDTKTPQLDYEMKHRPKPLERIGGIIRPVSAEVVATSILDGVRMGKFLIFPRRSTRLLYHFYRRFGGLTRWWLDGKVRRSL